MSDPSSAAPVPPGSAGEGEPVLHSGNAEDGALRRVDIYLDHKLDAIAARWDAKARSWDSELGDAACHLNEDAAYQRFLVQARATMALRREFCARNGVIDAGCGTGLVLQQVVTAFAWGIGVDLSPEMLRQARQKHLPGARFVLGDCFRLAALCPRAGAVLSRGVLLSHYGLVEGEALLRAARAALVPGGFILFDFLNASARGRYSHTAENKTYISRAEITSVARRAGFKVTEVLGESQRRVLLLLAE